MQRIAFEMLSIILSPKQILAANLKHLRSYAGWSEEELADRVSLHPIYSSLEERNVALANVLNVEAGLGVNPCELFKLLVGGAA